MHFKPHGTDLWYLFSTVKVKHLSPEPEIPEELLLGLSGPVNLRICAVNQAGCGECAELFVDLPGNFCKVHAN